VARPVHEVQGVPDRRRRLITGDWCMVCVRCSCVSCFGALHPSTYFLLRLDKSIAFMQDADIIDIWQSVIWIDASPSDM